MSPGEKVGGNERRLLLAIALLYKKHYEPPTWRDAWRAAGLSGASAYFTTTKAEKHGYITSKPNVAHSIRLTPLGVEAAVQGVHPRPLQRKHPQTPSNSSAALSSKATMGDETRFTSITRRAGLGVSLEGGGTMEASRRAFLKAARGEGFVAKEPPSKTYARLIRRNEKRAVGTLWYHKAFDSLTLADGSSLKVTAENVTEAVARLVAQGAPSTRVAAKKRPAARKAPSNRSSARSRSD